MTEANVIDLIYKNRGMFCTSYQVMVPNCYTSHDNEADVFAIRRSGFCDEFEVKISRSDFFNDAKKIVAYRDSDYRGDNYPGDRVYIDEMWSKPKSWRDNNPGPWQKKKYQALVDGDMSANYFWYIVKSGIVSASEVPEFAGLVFVMEDGSMSYARSPKRLHSSKAPFEERYRIASKMCYRYWDQRCPPGS